MNSRSQDALLGLLFFTTLIGLGVMTIVLSDFRFGVTTYRVEFVSDDVGFLRPGDPILVSGMTSGKVKELERMDAPVIVTHPDDGQPVECSVKVYATLELDPQVAFRRDFRLYVEDRGVLGGKLIRADLGVDDARIAPGTVFYLEAVPSVLQAAGDILDENRDDLRSTIRNLESITAKADGGEGPLGKLLSDSALSERIDTLMTNLADLSDGLVAGDGTIGKLLTDDEVYESVQTVMSDLSEMTAGLREGEGTLGKLLTDDEMHTNASALFEDLAAISADLRAGEGTAGRLLEDESLYDNANAMITEIRDTVGGVSDGDGLLAMLINDAELADKFSQAIDQLLGAVEDARETTPVQSLGSFIFGTF